MSGNGAAAVRIRGGGGATLDAVDVKTEGGVVEVKDERGPRAPDGSDLTPEERREIRERLKGMGYLG